MVHGNNISRMQPSLGSSLFLKSNIELLNYFAHGGVCSLLIGIEIQVLLWYQSTPEVAISVTRCWNKKQPKFFQKLPKKQPHQFDLKSNVFRNCPKSQPNIWVTLVIKFAIKKFQKSPNLVTLIAIQSADVSLLLNCLK